jgi:aarF domain-containing kinase
VRRDLSEHTGQAIGANSAMLPLPMQIKFSRLFDDAPQISTATVHSVLLSEFGRPPSGPNGIFEEFDDMAVASASIAQVHKAKLWERDSDGKEQWVAVKIQKPDVSKQVEWDLGAYKIVMWMFEHWIFDLPVYFVCGSFPFCALLDQLFTFTFIEEFVSDHLRRELDFLQEASNALQTSQLIASEPRLAKNVYIPKVYPSLSTRRILTAEWIDGVRLSDRAAIRRMLDGDSRTLSTRNQSGSPSRRLQGGVRFIMQTMVSLFSAQIFSFGWVHCDPHPGNIIIRPNPSSPTIPQLVLIDHGLYVRLSEDFKRQYAALWKGLLMLDWKAIEAVGREWGIGEPDLFASATLLKPVKYDVGSGDRNGSENGSGEDVSDYERSVQMKAKLKAFLADTDKMPKELIFLGRNMRYISSLLLSPSSYATPPKHGAG